MSVDEKDFRKLHLLVAKIARDAKITNSFCHCALMYAMDLFLKEVQRVLTLGKET